MCALGSSTSSLPVPPPPICRRPDQLKPTLRFPCLHVCSESHIQAEASCGYDEGNAGSLDAAWAR